MLAQLHQVVAGRDSIGVIGNGTGELKEKGRSGSKWCHRMFRSGHGILKTGNGTFLLLFLYTFYRVCSLKSAVNKKNH